MDEYAEELRKISKLKKIGFLVMEKVYYISGRPTNANRE